MDTSTEPQGIIGYGDLVLVYIDQRRKFIARVRRGGVLGTDKGVLRLDDLVGMTYGSRIKLSTGVPALILRPLLDDLLSLAYRRKSQVIYPKDLGYMLYIADVRPGSRVVEAGVGSGFLTSVLAAHVGSKGRVYGYEVRRDMAETARRNLGIAGLLDRVEIKVKDIREGIEEEELDAAFLDMPDPWNALSAVYDALRSSARLVAFLPTINQVEKFVQALETHGGYTDVHAVELLLREYRLTLNALRPDTRMIGHTGYIVHARRI